MVRGGPRTTEPRRPCPITPLTPAVRGPPAARAGKAGKRLWKKAHGEGAGPGPERGRQSGQERLESGHFSGIPNFPGPRFSREMRSNRLIVASAHDFSSCPLKTPDGQCRREEAGRERGAGGRGAGSREQRSEVGDQEIPSQAVAFQYVEGKRAQGTLNGTEKLLVAQLL